MQVSSAPDAPSPTVEAEGAAATPGESGGGQHRLVKNTLYLTLAQAVTIPLSVLSNAIAGRYLGSEEFGYMYTAATLCTFAVLALEWGQQGALPALVARDHAKAHVYLGTSLVWRTLMAVLISGVLAGVCLVLGYEAPLRWAVALSFPLAVLNSFNSGYKDTIRGFERTDIPAKAHVAQQLLMVVIIIPVLLLGGHLRSMLISHIAIAALIVLYLARAMRPLGVQALKYDRQALKPLFEIGTPFVFFGLALVIQPTIDATYLAKLAPPSVVGWFAVSQRLIGLLIFPASALIGALYPTLCRLQIEDKAEFVRVTRSAVYGVALLAIPAAIGCGMFAEVGVAIFGSGEFSGSITNLRLMSVFVFLVYFSMPLGTAIMASGRQKSWALVQCIGVTMSLVLDPILIPMMQERMGNGGLGPCLAISMSEMMVVTWGAILAPKGLFDRQLVKSLLLAILAGAAMAGVAWFTKPITLFLAVPAALLTYGGLAFVTGAIQPSTIDMVKGFVSRKLSRAR